MQETRKRHKWNKKNECEYCGAVKVIYSKDKITGWTVYGYAHERTLREVMKKITCKTAQLIIDI